MQYTWEGFDSWETMNKPTMKALEATDEQKHLYDAYGGPFECPILDELFVIRLPKDVELGLYTGICNVVLRAHGGGMVSDQLRTHIATHLMGTDHRSSPIFAFLQSAYSQDSQHAPDRDRYFLPTTTETFWTRSPPGAG